MLTRCWFCWNVSSFWMNIVANNFMPKHSKDSFEWSFISLMIIPLSTSSPFSGKHLYQSWTFWVLHCTQLKFLQKISNKFSDSIFRHPKNFPILKSTSWSFVLLSTLVYAAAVRQQDSNHTTLYFVNCNS